MALFGEKYGDTVRVVEIPGILAGAVRRHPRRATGDIGPFLIVSEGSVAAGVRRSRPSPARPRSTDADAAADAGRERARPCVPSGQMFPRRSTPFRSDPRAGARGRASARPARRRPGGRSARQTVEVNGRRCSRPCRGRRQGALRQMGDRLATAWLRRHRPRRGHRRPAEPAFDGDAGSRRPRRKAGDSSARRRRSSTGAAAAGRTGRGRRKRRREARRRPGRSRRYRRACASQWWRSCGLIRGGDDRAQPERSSSRRTSRCRDHRGAAERGSRAAMSSNWSCRSTALCS